MTLYPTPHWVTFLCGVWTGVFLLAWAMRIAQARRLGKEKR
jgi:hypothetical protein